MHVFDEQEKLVKFANVTDMINHYIGVRMHFYVKRKIQQVAELAQETLVLTNKARFITEVLDDVLDLRRKKTAEVSVLLQSRKYDTVQGDRDYKYLVRLPMDSVTAENVEKIIKEKERKETELNELQAKSETQIWLSELKTLKEEYIALYRKAATGVAATGAATVKKVLKLKVRKEEKEEKELKNI